MEQIILNAEIRKKTGTSAAKKVRVKGVIPAVVYAKHEEPVHLTVNYKDFTKLLHKEGENAIIGLKIKNDAQVTEKMVIIKEIQADSIKDGIYHVDFLQIKLTEKIRVHVQLATKGDADAPGVKDGGILEHILREIEIECLPTNIPKEISLDVSSMKIGDIIHVKDLKVAEGIDIITDADQIAVLLKFEAEEKPVEEKPAEEGAVEPEVIKKGKTEEEEAAEEEKK